MRYSTLGLLVVSLVLSSAFAQSEFAQSDKSRLIARIPYGTCEGCITLILHEMAGVSSFTVSPDGSRFYLVARNLMVFDRTGKLLHRFETGAHFVGTDGSFILYNNEGVDLQPFELPSRIAEREARETGRKIEEIGKRLIWILTPEGRVDWERTERFHRALQEFLKANPAYKFVGSEVVFFTGDRLGVYWSAPVTTSESGEISLDAPCGLAIFKGDGSWAGLYPACAVSKRGAFWEDIALRSLEAQQEVFKRMLDPRQLVEYHLVRDTGEEVNRQKASPFQEAMEVVMYGEDGRAGRALRVRLDEVREREGVLLKGSAPYARLDRKGRLYNPAFRTELVYREIEVPGQQTPLGLENGHLVLRFGTDGRFEKVVAYLEMPDFRAEYWRLWDVDDAGNLYYLKFNATDVEVRMIPAD